MTTITTSAPAVDIFSAPAAVSGQSAAKDTQLLGRLTGLFFLLTYATSIPPVLTLFSIVTMTTLFGFMGAFLGTPLTAAILVLIKMIYVEDVLGDREIEVLGEAEANDHG